jgi:hypothetical protein
MLEACLAVVQKLYLKNKSDINTEQTTAKNEKTIKIHQHLGNGSLTGYRCISSKTYMWMRSSLGG